MYQTIIVQKEDQVVTITLNRPERLNAISDQLRQELKSVVDDMEIDDDIRVIILTGSGDRAFCVGNDIKESAEQDIFQRRESSKITNDLINKLEGIPKPVIAAINGYALGGGCELALGCDLIIAAENSSFGLPEINIASIPGAGGTQRLPRLVGKLKAKELMFTGERISAQEALRIGLVNRVVPKEELLNVAKELADTLAKKPPLSLMQIKHLVNRGMEMPLSSALDFAREAYTLTFVSEDRKEGTRAFAEKREPQFKGR